MPNYHRLFIPNSYVFLTIVTYNRKPILIKNIDILRQAFRNVKLVHPFEIIACTVLPEHIHLILNPENITDYPQIVSSIKYYVSRNINMHVDNLPESKIKKREKGIWHRRYFEHTIVDESDLNKHIDYIHYNPVKHKIVKSVKDWKYSSFHKFVKNNLYDAHWGTIKESENFINLYDD